MLCGVHVGRAHGKKLQELQGKSSFSQTFINLHKEKFPRFCKMYMQWEEAQYYVTTRNKPSCGCMGETKSLLCT